MSRDRVPRNKAKRSSAQTDTMAIDVANVSDDVYYDRRNLRDSLNNSDSMRTSSSSSSGSRHPSGNTRLHSPMTVGASNKSRSPPPPPSHSDNNHKMQNEQIVDVPNFRDMVVPTSNSTSANSKTIYVNTKFEKKDTLESIDTLDGSHLDWEGDGITVGSAEVEFNEIDLKKKEKGAAAIVVHDNKEGGEGGGRAKEKRSSSTLFHKSRRASLGLDMPIFSRVSRKSSRAFESIWGDATDEDSMYSNSAGSKERKSWKNFVYRVKSHGKMVLLCIAISVILIAVMSVLIAMVPMWLQSEERGESAELGGLAYGKGDGVMMDSSGVMTDNSSDGGLVDSEEEVPATSKLVLTPPPYNLDYLCKQESLLEEGGYDKCVSACFPSRCCLVDESQTYEVWTLHIGANDIEEIGKSISSCYKDREDTCIRYNQACSVLGKDSLLPIKPPSSKEVLAMNNVEKLHLAETIIRACSPRVEGSNEGLAECQALCETKACCFVEDIEEDESVRVTDTGASSILDIPANNSTGASTVLDIPVNNSTGASSVLDIPTNATEANSILDIPTNLEEEPNTAENSGRKIRSKYCGDDPQQYCITYAGCEAYFQ
eukprot:CAMPEP_0113374720 /NCGR_PEP_ID=MMETSP0013_2-20120614/1732_1 /TAXON_ID=2843 ORGANISM="Skeletonema costatum, Strain 1716" /NCGR_SAMPLE_ID=MMETSP0013_2 /ASSEMBLY_ACC=CAM_ASM_000158 /LENGTH=598 /DNA_ID=CAMNT_0000256725 /DNA_START=100 /DNA_END=1897 /DNA_ORIENTATION=+ /assembly_acc=CAM_ASM_000158